MTVRWKPLVFLSGVFLIVGVIGVSAIILTLVPRSPQGLLRWARSSREAGRFADAEMIYKQVLQHEPKAKDAAIHEEFAGLYRDWATQAPAEKRPALRHERIDHLASAPPSNMTRRSRGREWNLLRDSMQEDDVPSSNSWAKEVLNVDPRNVDAHYTLALEALEARPPNLPEVCGGISRYSTS